MAIEGVDALGHPDPLELIKAGKKFVAQYTKNVSTDIINSYRAHGLEVVLLSERGGSDALGGFSAGVARGQADAAALEALGAPAGTACYVAEADFNPVSGQYAEIGQYALGHKSGLGTKFRSGFYGGLEAVTAAKNAGYTGFLFQTYAWSGGVWLPGTTLQQYQNSQSIGGVPVDFTRAMAVDYGQWGYTAPVKPRPPAVPTVSLAKVQKAAKIDPPAPNGHKTFPADVMIVEKALDREGFLAPKFVDGSYGTLTIQAYSRWQQKMGFRGKDANGVPGIVSLTALGKKYGFKVTA